MPEILVTDANILIDLAIVLEHERMQRYTARELHRLLSEIRKVNQWLPAKLCQERLVRWQEEE